MQTDALVAPTTVEYVPAGHALHVVPALRFENVPAGQGLQGVGELLPFGE